MKILIIDDNHDLLEMLEIALSMDYEVYTSTNGKEGISSILQKKPDLIFLDIMMKGLNGVDVLKLIRNDDITKNTPLFIMSALVDDKTILKCKELHANGYLKKPFRIQSIKDLIEDFENKKIELDIFQIYNP